MAESAALGGPDNLLSGSRRDKRRAGRRGGVPLVASQHRQQVVGATRSALRLGK